MKTKAPSGLLFCVMLLGAILAGCSQPAGPGGVDIHGKLTKGGSPIPQPTEGTYQVMIKLVSVDQPNAPAVAVVVKDDGSFSFNEMGVAEGKYKVVVIAGDPYSGKDDLEDAFSVENTPVVWEITGSSVEKNLDLDNPE